MIVVAIDLPDRGTTGGTTEAVKAFVALPRAFPLPAELLVWGVGETAAFPRPLPFGAASRTGCGGIFPAVFG